MNQICRIGIVIDKYIIVNAQSLFYTSIVIDVLRIFGITIAFVFLDKDWETSIKVDDEKVTTFKIFL